MSHESPDPCYVLLSESCRCLYGRAGLVRDILPSESRLDGSVGGGVGGWMLMTRTGGGGAGPDGCDLAAAGGSDGFGGE